MIKNNISDIFFDLDHTLWDFDKNSDVTYKSIFQELSINANINDFLGNYKKINLDLWKLFREEKIDKDTLRYTRLKKTFDSINYSLSDDTLLDIADLYVKYLSTQTHLLDGAIEVLDYLKPNYKLHIITNGFHDVQEAKLKNSNLNHYFDVVMDSEVAGVKKPNSIIFEKALNKANVSKVNSIMIGDNYEADVLGALNSGIDAICFNYHNEFLPPEIKTISKLKELINIF